MVGDHEQAAGLERCEQLAVHDGAVDLHEGRVVIEEEERDDIEARRRPARGSSNGRAAAMTFFIAGVLIRASKAAFARSFVSAAFCP